MDYTGKYIAGDRIDKIANIVVGKLYILHNVDHNTKYLVRVTDSSVNSKEGVERITYVLINPETGKRGISSLNDFNFTLWDYQIERSDSWYIMHTAVSTTRKYRTFALIVSYGIRWYGADATVRRVFFAKRNPLDFEDSRTNFYYRDQISTSSVLRILRLINDKKYVMNYNPIICGPRLWDKDMPDDEGATPYCRMPSVDLSFDVPN